MAGLSFRCALLTLMILALAGAGLRAQDADLRKLEQGGLNLELAALQPDQVRGFFMGRGFSAAQADFIFAKGCVFRSSIGSAFTTQAAAPVTVALRDWRLVTSDLVTRGGKAAAPMTREDWEAIWNERGAGEDAAVAFYWALFPTKQTFAASDYNWGMLTFGLPPGTRFSLDLRWQTGTTQHKARLENLQCGK